LNFIKMKKTIVVSPLLSIVCSVFWLFSGYAGQAQAQTDAYSVEVAVFDRSREEQIDAYSVALRRVLLSNSGDKTLLNRDDVRNGLKQAESYVQGFSFRAPAPGTVIPSDTPLTRKVQETGQATQLMLVRFDRTLVDALIFGAISGVDRNSLSSATDETGAPVVPINLDSALVWLLIQDQGRDIQISDPAAANVQNRAREIAGAAGISLVYPTGDEEDQLSLTSQDILLKNVERINLASARYRQDVVLSGSLSRLGARGWRGEWVHIVGDQAQQTVFETSSLDEALQKGIGVLGDAAVVDESYRYGGSATSDTEALVWVGSLNSTADYANVMAFFEALPTVATVYPKEVQQNAMVFSVVPRSSLLDIESGVFNTSWLQRSTVPISDQSNSIARNADFAIEYRP